MYCGKTFNREHDVEGAVFGYVQQCRICSMEELFRHLPGFTANQLFMTVDRLSREGKVVLRYGNRAEYVILRADRTAAVRREMSGARIED